MLVLKFGGTSVEDAAAIERVCAIVRSRVTADDGRRQEPAVVVVSALGGATDKLLEIGTLAERGELAKALNLTRALAARHLRLVRALLPRKQAAEIAGELRIRINRLQSTVEGVAAVRELTARTTDRLLAFGELASSTIVAAALAARGIHSELVDAREVIVTNDDHTRALPDLDVTDTRLQARIKPLALSGKVVVLGGFIGATAGGATTTLGRGGSDYSATIVAAALAAKRVEIWTDVDGIMTADPKLCPEARTLERVTFEEAAEMAHFGAKVIHPWSLAPARARGIPVHVRNSRNPDGPATVIVDDKPEIGFKAIAVKRGVTVVEVAAERRQAGGGFLAGVFDAIERHGCHAEVVATTDATASFSTVNKAGVAALAAELGATARVRSENSKAIVSLVGDHAGSVPTTVYGALADVHVRLSAHGASRLTVSFVVNDCDVVTAVRKLHRAVFEGPIEVPACPSAELQSAATFV